MDEYARFKAAAPLVAAFVPPEQFYQLRDRAAKEMWYAGGVGSDEMVFARTVELAVELRGTPAARAPNSPLLPPPIVTSLYSAPRRPGSAPVVTEHKTRRGMDDRADALAYALYAGRGVVQWRGQTCAASKHFRGLIWVPSLDHGTKMYTCTYAATGQSLDVGVTDMAMAINAAKHPEDCPGVPDMIVHAARSMGIFDDLEALERGETLMSAMGVFSEGDRVVVRRERWTVEGSEDLSHVGTVRGVEASGTLHPGVYAVEHDRAPGTIRHWVGSALIHLHDWVASPDYDAECKVCHDTQYQDGEPEQGACKRCFHQGPHYGRSDNAWAEARKRRQAARQSKS